jgi:CRP-like cAMP-binding protein
MRRYLNFVWECTEKVGETETEIIDKLSPSLRMKLSVHVFGRVLTSCPFLAWMQADVEAKKKLCLRVKTVFFEANDVLFSYGEINTTVYIMTNGWMTLCLGDLFGDEEEMDHDGGEPKSEGGLKGGVARRNGNMGKDQKQMALERVHKQKIKEMASVAQDAFRSSFYYASNNHKGPGATRRYTYIHAPAFFGESQLFLSSPEPTLYSARCMTRAEFTTVTKEDIEAVLRELPYLRYVFDQFSANLRAKWAQRGRARENWAKVRGSVGGFHPAPVNLPNEVPEVFAPDTDLGVIEDM